MLLCSHGCGTLPQVQPSISAAQIESKTAGRVNINTATTVELEGLPGVGKVIAERIVEHRTRFGPFRRVEHLMMVRGISEKKFLQMQPLIKAD